MALDGHLLGQDIDARLQRALDGDANMTMGSQRYQIDRDSRGEYVQLRGSKINGEFRRDLREGDESGELRQGARIGFQVDRDPVSGNFDITGWSSAGPYKLHVERSHADGDLRLSGTLPQGSESFPLLWEVLGDDKNIPDNIPFYPSCLLGMSMFLAK